MIIVRQKDANPVASLEPGPMIFSQMVSNAKTVDIVYVDKVFKAVNLNHKPFITFKLIGELERKNLPFILLLDTKCEIFKVRNENVISIVNADSVSKELLESDAQQKGTNAFLLHETFLEFLDYYDAFKGDSVVAELFDLFVGGAETDGLMNKNTLFITLTPDEQIKIFNESAGHPYNSGKLWYYPETKPLIKVPQKIESLDVRVENFSKKFEHNYMCELTDFNKLPEDLRVALITKYPKLFSDLFTKGYSAYNPFDYKYVERFPSEFQLPVAEEEQEDFQDYFEALDTLPIDMSLCYACEETMTTKQSSRVEIDDKTVWVCKWCCTGFD